jgi:ribosomal protein S18 acetylase RimI-like enzyme
MSATPTIDVRSATPVDEAAAIGVITLAFGTDPMARLAFGDTQPSCRDAQFVRAFGGSGFARGATHLVEGGWGAAMWLPPGVTPDADTMMAFTKRYVPKERLDDMLQVFTQMERFHPAGDCWYLPLIGVDPACQGRGCGSALLLYALQQCDRDGVAAYLESSNPRNIPLYERHGFEALGAIQSGTSPTMVPMLRRPHASVAAGT